MTTLGDISGEINAELGNRRDVMTYTVFPGTPNLLDTDRLAIWLKDAYNEICLGYRFEELETSVTDAFVPNIDVYQLPVLCRTLRAITLLYGINQQPRPVRRRHIRNIRRYQTSSLGPPSIYAPFNPGGQPSIIVRPIPDQGYPLIWDIVSKPTFATIPPAPVNQSVFSTVIQLPDDWIGVLRSLTKLKGHTALQEPDKAQAEQTYLFGGYEPGLGRKVPGVIRQLTAPRDQTDIEDVEFGLQPMVRRYTNTP